MTMLQVTAQRINEVRPLVAKDLLFALLFYEQS